MKVTTDVDIDVLDRDAALAGLKYRIARIDRDDTYTKHNTGVYFQDIPYDPMTGLTTIDYKRAEDLGYMKIDFLNNSVYKGVKDEDHLNRLLEAEPVWSLLDEKEVVEKLFHINQHADLVARLKPRSVKQLAMLLAIIRPGKAHLQNRTWPEIEKEVWIRPKDDSYFFKKSHAHGYALAIIVQMNLMVEQALLI